MPSPSPLEYGTYYHIFNRGNNSEDIFAEKRNYRFFMARYARYIEPVAYTYAYCLMKNHFHFLLRSKTPQEQRETHGGSQVFRVLEPSRQFGNLFNGYAKAFNKLYGRTGGLFQHPFRRIEVEEETHLMQLVIYMHRNPQAHGFVDDFRDWPFSSYQAIVSSAATHLQRDTVLEWFGGREGFLEGHVFTPRDPKGFKAAIKDSGSSFCPECFEEQVGCENL